MNELVIETRDLTRRYGELTAVDGLGLEVPRDGVYGFLGPNGAGKTTTIRMLLGLIRPDSGDVRLFGREMKRERIVLLGRVGALVETPSLYRHLTGRDNLEITRRMLGENREAVERALGMVGLEQAANRRVGTYSSGMQQRLGLATALLGRPRLLILDEPTNGLDPAGIREVRSLIHRLPQEDGVTVFLSSHLLGEVEQVADRLGIIQDGRLRYQGTLAELQARRQARLILGTNRPEQTARRLREEGWSARPASEGRLILEIGGEEEAARINALLVGSGFSIFELRVEQPSLEDIFLGLMENEAGDPR